MGSGLTAGLLYTRINMNRKYILILLVIPFLFWGCTPPPISVLYLTNTKYYDDIVEINNSVYFLDKEYNLYDLSNRLKDTLITSSEVTKTDGSEYKFDNLKLSDSTLVCSNSNTTMSFNIKDIEFVDLYRKATSEDKTQGWMEAGIFTALGLTHDIASKEKGRKVNFTGTIIGGAIGLTLAGIFIFKNYEYEEIYFKHS